MAAIKRHWRLMSILVLGFVLTASWTWHLLSERTAFALQQSPEPLSDVQYSAMLGLLDELNLDRDALVALNLSENQASSTLSVVRTWYGTNELTLHTLQNTIHEKTHAVRVIEKAIAMGPLDPEHEQQLASARQDLATAQAAYQTALAPVKVSVSAGLSASQKSTWTAIQSGHGPSMPLRMLDLNDSQRVAISKAWDRYRYTHAAAETSEARAAAVTAWQTELNQILTSAQQIVVSSYNSNYETASANVANAWNTALVVGQEG